MKPPSRSEIEKALVDWESKTWEFKRKDYLGVARLMESSIVEAKDWALAGDIASFANTHGGHMVIGISNDGNVDGFSIDDKLRNRISRVIRHRMSPVPLYDISVVQMEAGKNVTVISIAEGDGDLCTVKGTVFVRDLNGIAAATGAEITRMVKKRLGKKLKPAPTEREIVDSPYNLPSRGKTEQAILADFEKVAQSCGLEIRKTTRSISPNIRWTYVWASFSCNKRNWHFWVVAHGGNFGPQDYKYIGRNLKDCVKYRDPQHSVVPEGAEVCPLILIMGRINSLTSILGIFGLSLVATRFGGYSGRGDAKYGHLFDGDIMGHRFMLSGITDAEAMRKRMDSFLDWMKANQTKLSKIRASH